MTRKKGYENMWKKFVSIFKSFKPVVSIDFDSMGNLTFLLSYIDNKIELDDNELNEKINQLGDIREKLIDAANTIHQIKVESEQKKIDLIELRTKYETVKNDNVEIEKLLNVNQDSFARLLIVTNKKTRKRTIIEGVIIGFITGVGSSFLVWLLTKS